MCKKVVFVGPPRSGKTTLINRLLDYYRKQNYIIYGFLTPEIIRGNKRIGFNIFNLSNNKTYKFARKGNYKTDLKLGNYSIFLESFKRLIEELKKLNYNSSDILILDEIGKMELYSKDFENFLYKIFTKEINIIASIGEKLHHPVKQFILNNTNVITFHLNLQNQEEIFDKVIEILF